MSNTLYLCKIAAIPGQNEYVVIYNEKPEKNFKQYEKERKRAFKRYCENDKNYSIEDFDETYRKRELLSYTKREFNLISVRIEISNDVKRIRSVIEGNEYDYSSIKFQEKTYQIPYLTDLFDVFDFRDYSFDEIKEVYNTIEDKNGIVVLKRIKGKYIFLYYLYDIDVSKSTVLDRIKNDFKEYNINKFYEYDDKASKAGIRFLKFDKIKKERYLNISSIKSITKYDIIWLENKIGIKLDADKINDMDYIKSIKPKLDNLRINSDYLDYSSRCYEFEGSSDEIIKLNEKQIKAIEDYNDKIYKEFGIDIDDVENTCMCEKEYGDDPIDDDEPVIHIGEKKGSILFVNSLKYKDLPVVAKHEWFCEGVESFNSHGFEIKFKDCLRFANYKKNYKKDKDINIYNFYLIGNKKINIDGYYVSETTQPYVECYKTKYVNKVVYFKYSIYLKNSEYSINGHKLVLNGNRDSENMIVIYYDEKPVINSKDYLEECIRKQQNLIKEKEQEIIEAEEKKRMEDEAREARRTIVGKDVYGPVMIKERGFLTGVNEYKYTRITYYYADGHTEEEENKVWVRRIE